MALRNDVPADGEAASAWRDQPARTPGTDRRPWPHAGADQASTAGDISATRLPLVVTLAIFALAFLLPAWPWL